MKVILIQGKANTGKTTLCNRIDEWLQRELLREKGINLRIEMTKHFSKKNDFFAVYDIYTNKDEEKTDSFKARIFINSGSEEKCIIPFGRFYKNENKEYYKNNHQPDLLITAIRPSKTLYKKTIKALNLDNLEELNLSSISCSYKEDTFKKNLLIQLEKTPLELIKEKIRELF